MISKEINIWQQYDYQGIKSNGEEPKLTTYIIKGEQTRGVVLILPGGGYGMTSPRESEPIALKFNSAGYHAFVLDYSCAPNVYPQSLYDVARGLTLMKENAHTWQLDLSKIYVCGFSAGGHLAATIANKYKESWLNEVDGIDLNGLNLRGSILSYPVLTAGEFRHVGSFENLLGSDISEEERLTYSMEDLVNVQTPETFIWHTVEDKSVPVENTLLYISALQKQGIVFECHIYPKGSHGISLATKETATNESQINDHVASWMGLCCDWMKSHI